MKDWQSRRYAPPLFVLGGIHYRLRGDRLIKAAQRQIGDRKTDDKGRLWEFADTRRWRLVQGQKAQAADDGEDLSGSDRFLHSKGILAQMTPEMLARTEATIFDKALRNPYFMVSEGRHYNSLLAEHGGDEAKAQSDLRELSKKIAKHKTYRALLKILQGQEQEFIEQSGDERLSLEYEAMKHRRPDQMKGATLAQFKADNPGEVDKVIGEYREEQRLDEVLSLDGIMARGAEKMRSLEERIAANPNNQNYAFYKLRESLIKMPYGEAKTLAENLEYSSEIPESDIQYLKTILAQAFEVTGGAGATSCRKLVQASPRAWAKRQTGEINIGSYVSESITWHELGHHIEFENPRLEKAAHQWRDSRATSSTPKPINEIQGVNFYRPDEIALPGPFADAYVAKIYSDGTTEILSMGLQHFAQPHDMQKLYERDKSMFQFMLGVLTDV